jgi:hypothetical protein
MTAIRPTDSQKVAAERINTMSTDAKGCEPSVVPSDTFVPIFVLSRDRVTSLQQVLQSYNRTLSSPYEIIILDHFSTYPPMLEYLRELSSSGVRVHALKSPLWKDALKESGFVIQDYLAAHPHAAFYVFTDSDIALVRSSPDILLFFAGLLRSCKELNVVGPHLQISDIPDSYADRKKVLLHEKKFWSDVPNMATWNGVGYHVSRNPIDTTFAMRRRDLHFARLQNPCFRTFAPFAAVHVDWYYNTSFLPDDKIWYLNHSQPNVNHW